MKLISAALLALALAACGEKPAAEPDAAEKADAAYKVDLTLTPRAIAKLKEMGEKVTVSSMFLGLAAKPEPNSAGPLDLGQLQRDVEPENQTVAITAPPFAPSRLKEITGKPLLLINVVSARVRSPDNLLDCGIFEDTLEKAVSAPIEIACDLIEPAAPAPPK
jgi:predicted small lipoprotein YifL